MELRPFTAFLHLVVAQAYRRRNCASSWWDTFEQRFATTKYLDAGGVYGDAARALLRTTA